MSRTLNQEILHPKIDLSLSLYLSMYSWIFMIFFDVMICQVQNISFLFSMLLPTKYMKIDAKVDVPNWAYGLKYVPKACGCYSVCFSCSPTSTE